MTAEDILHWLEAHSDPDIRAGLLNYGIPNDNALGVRMCDMKRYAKALPSDHGVALQLWENGLYEARTIAAMLADADEMTPAQVDDWCEDFDSWAICDTACFELFDQLPFAWEKVHEWAGREEEFVKRAAFALIWSLSVHDKTAPNKSFSDTLSLMEKAATDDRPLVKKAVDMALRATGKRNYELNQLSIQLAKKLAGSSDKSAAWIGRQSLKKLDDPDLQEKLKAKT